MTKAIFRFAVTVLAAAALMTVSTGAQGQGGAGRAGGAPAAAPAQPDFSQVQIKTTKLTNNFYTLEGQGGTIGALVGPDGVFLVDSQFAPLTDKIVAAVKQISDGRIRFLVNTHVHGDHTGGNENFGKLGVVILSRPQLRARLVKPSPAANGTTPPSAPAAALPMVTYDAPVTVTMNGEEIRLIPVPAAHTDGDTMVRFQTADVIMTGDFYRSIQYSEHRQGQRRIVERDARRTEGGGRSGRAQHEDHPGHGPIVDKTAVSAHRDMIIALRDKVAGLVRRG